MTSSSISLLQLREVHHFDIPQLAWYADVPDRLVYFALLGYPIEKADADRIIAALPRLVNVPDLITRVVIVVEEVK